MTEDKEGRPTSIELEDGTIYRATVLKVTRSDEKGPRDFTLVRENESTKVEQGTQFWIVYASEAVLAMVQ